MTIINTHKTISFKNSGGILAGMEQALKGGVSIPRNPCIFNLFLALGITDHGGYGIPNIFSKMKTLKMITPEFNESWNRDETFLLLNFSQIYNVLSKDEQKVVSYLSSHLEGVSSSMIADLLSCSNETARQILNKLILLGEAVDNGKLNKGRLYYIMNKENTNIDKIKIQIDMSNEFKNNMYVQNDIKINNINSILVKIVKYPRLLLKIYSDDGQVERNLIRYSQYGYCIIDMEGLGYYVDGFIPSDVNFININNFIYQNYMNIYKFEILADNNELILTGIIQK